MLLKLENIGKIYDTNNILTVGVSGVNLEFDYNEFVIVEGESGSGKSTLLNVIGANDSYEEGELYINGSETSHFTSEEWEDYRAKYIATVFQDFNIIENLTVAENVELALMRIDDIKLRKQTALRLIEKVGLTKQILHKGSQLSGGEKQRTVIARALAKDSPIILADEPTGNLDVTASKETARLLKEISKDRLVIVVTHNAEFFDEYATRKITVFDGKVSDDRIVEKPDNKDKIFTVNETTFTRAQTVKNTLTLGILNYKSRPRFSALMSFSLSVCAAAIFFILGLFINSLVNPLKQSVDAYAIGGKVLVSSDSGNFDGEKLEKLVSETNAEYFLPDNSLSGFEINIAKSAVRGIKNSYTVTCLYAPYLYDLKQSEAVLTLPYSAKHDKDFITGVFLSSDTGINDIKIKYEVSTDINLYLSYEDLVENGAKIKVILSSLSIGDSNSEIYAYRINENLSSGKINLINSNFYNVIGKTAALEADASRTYVVSDDSKSDSSVNGLVVELSPENYGDIFDADIYSDRACLYFESDKAAEKSVSNLSDGYIGIISTGKIYVSNADEIYVTDIIYYLAMIAISFCFGMIISIIFMRSVKVYKNEFAVYRTLGISGKIAKYALYVQMTLIFLPTLVVLPLISLIAAVVPGSAVQMITAGNYLFIELMIFLIVEFVALTFNKNINKQSIRKSLKRN